MISDNRVLDVVLFLAVLIPSVIFHEVTHGWVAERLGDPTARRAGRITLNPIRHVDPFGSLLFPAVLAVAGQNVWGWARPVPVEPQHFRRPTAGHGPGRRGRAGEQPRSWRWWWPAWAAWWTCGRPGAPAALGGGVYWEGLGVGIRTGALWGRVLFAFVLVNCSLAVFNMLPIPPLDGSRLVPLVLPPGPGPASTASPPTASWCSSC